jgi:GntR family transcriptional regulator
MAVKGRVHGRPAHDKPEDAKKTKEVADELRTLILSGEWRPGHVLPSQRELESKYRVSTVTVRNAVSLLAEEGLIEKSQGRRSLVADREPVHPLVIRRAGGAADPAAVVTPQELGSGEPGPGEPGPEGPEWREGLAAGERRVDLVTEPPIAFLGGPEAVAPQRRAEQRRTAVPRIFATLLGLESGRILVERAITLAVGGEPILVSTSYLPLEAAGDDLRWREAEVGELAVAGARVLAEPVEDRVRMPVPAESEALRIGRGVPVRVLSRRCRVLLDDQPVPAGVIVLARGDRVFLRWD